MKKRTFLVLIGIFIVLMVVIGIVYFTLRDSEKSSVVVKPDSINLYIEKGAEAYAQVAKPAVEAYANQDISESTESRQKRLEKHFASNSPVFERELDIRVDNSAIKTVAKVTSVSFSRTAEGNYPCQ